jgi:hypothetical protein
MDKTLDELIQPSILISMRDLDHDYIYVNGNY